VGIKSSKIEFIVKYFQEKYGINNIIVNDHWKEDEEAIGLIDKTGKYLIYISTLTDIDGIYYAALEYPQKDESFPYVDGGDFENLTIAELEVVLSDHLKLKD
jgi:hypothetical protein